MRKTREEKAITLIALIITIVVLLILAVVAINAITGDGIIQHAINAKTEYEDAQDEEKDVLSYYGQYLQTEGKAGDWIQNKTIVKNVKTGQKLEVGDYVDYKSNVEGYTDVKGWRVLGAENGQILLLSSDIVETNFAITEKETLNNTAITKLNNLCGKYGKGTGATNARSITVQDVNKITAYNPLKTGNGLPYRSGNIMEYGNKVEFRINNNGKVEGVSNNDGRIYTSTYSDLWDIDGTKLVSESEYSGLTGTAKSIQIQSDFYAYYPDTLTITTDGEVKGIAKDSAAYKLLFRNRENSADITYCLSEFYIKALEEGTFKFGLRTVYGSNGIPAIGGTIMGASWTLDIESEDTVEFNVRAVVYLKNDIELTKQGENSWTINK